MLCLHQTIKIGKDEPVGLEGNAYLHYAKELIAGHYGNDPALVPFDFPHILVALAPRPLFINAPLHDSNVKVSGVRDCVDAAMPVYDDVFRAKERLVAIYADAGHEFPSRIRAAAYAFAARLGANTPEVARDRAESFRLVEGAAGDGGVRAQFARPLTFLAVITALVLVVACTNFTNLMFARAEARRREFLIRLALGGGQWRLIRESAAECLALAAIAGALALLFASWASPMAMSLVSALEPLDFAIGLNARVLAFAGACLVAAAAVGLWPCVRLVRSTMISSVHDHTGTAGARPLANRLMLIGQLVVCAILMFGAGLLLRTVINLRTQDLGYERDVLLIPLAAERPGRPPEAAPALVEHLRQQNAAIPGRARGRRLRFAIPRQPRLLGG